MCYLLKIIHIYYMADLEEVYDEFYEKLNNGGEIKKSCRANEYARI